VLSYDPSLQPVHVNGSLVNYTRAEVLNAAEVSLIHRGDGNGYDGDTGMSFSLCFENVTD
jgi:alpha-L-fucosidase 2